MIRGRQLICLLLSSVAIASAAQAKLQSPTAVSPSSPSLGQSQTPDGIVPAGEPFHIERSTQLVLIPAIVTDRAGHVVSGLKANDFTVRDDNRSCQLRSVQEI